MDDTISRQVAIDELIAMREHIDARMSVIGGTAYEMAIEALREPERKKGKWMSHYDYCEKHGLLPSGLIAFWWCDQCEQGVEHPTNFCPNCGADMRGEQDG